MTDADKAAFASIKSDMGDAYRNWKPSSESIQRMNNGLIERINKKVGENDYLFHLGDICFGQDKKNDIVNILRKINCKNILLLLGNHDHFEDLQYAQQVVSEKNIVVDKYHELRFGKVPVALMHYPIVSFNGANKSGLHLFGHCHGTLAKWIAEHAPTARMMDVGVDCHPNYEPFSYDEIMAYMATKTGNSVDHHDPEKMKIVRDKNGNH